MRDGANLALGSEDILEPYHYVYAQALRMELLPKAKENAEADLQYLERLGVIELTRTRPQKPSSTLQAAPPEEKHETRRVRKAKPTQQTNEPDPQGRAGEQEQMANEPQAAKVPLSSLTPIQLAVLEAIPDDRAVSADFISGLEYPYGEAIAALTMLEIMGVIQKLPGGLYVRT